MGKTAFLSSDLENIEKDDGFLTFWYFLMSKYKYPLSVNILVLNTFEETRRIWHKFERASDCYGFQTYEWLNNWFITVGKKMNIIPCLVKVEAGNGEPLMLLPLGIINKYGVQCLQWMGGTVTDYHAPMLGKRFSVLVDSEIFCSLWEQIKKVLPCFDVIHFEKQPEHIYEQYNPFLYLDCWQFHEKSYSATLDDSWENFSKSKKRKNIYADSRRQRRRLTEIGDLKFKVAGDCHDVEMLTSKMIEQKIRRYQETGVRNLFEDEKYRSFYLDTAKELARTGIVHVSGLFLDDTIIAVHWGLIFRDRFYYIMPSYEGGPWAKYSPGRLLQEHLIKLCFDSGIKIFDFTVGDDSYKYNWADNEMELYEYYEPVNLKGKQYILIAYIRQNLKKYSNLLNSLRAVKNFLRK